MENGKLQELCSKRSREFEFATIEGVVKFTKGKNDRRFVHVVTVAEA